MTTSQTRQHILGFAITPSEDPMEVTTDMDRQLDTAEDIDIDLDFTGDVPQDEEDEYMGEDGEKFLDADTAVEQDPNAANDDEMADGGSVEGSIAEGSSVHDVDLEDAEYVESVLDEDVIQDAAVEDPTVPSSGLLDNFDQTVEREPHDRNQDDQNIAVANRRDSGNHEKLSTRESDLEVAAGMLAGGPTKAPIHGYHATEPIYGEALHTEGEENNEWQQATLAIKSDEPGMAVNELSNEEHEEYHGEEDRSGSSERDDIIGDKTHESELAKCSETEQAEIPASTQNRSNPSSTTNTQTHLQNPPIDPQSTFPLDPISLHPVVVIYQDAEISLFPPISRAADLEEEEERSSTYFLQDEHLAGHSIQKLLGALRSVLGDSISDQDELTIEIGDLGLHISEFSTDCSTISLSEVIDIYVHLQHYDGLDSPPPLYMSLAITPRFSHRWEFLLVALTEKKGLSQTRSSYAIERQQFEAEEVQVLSDGDDRSQIDLMPHLNSKTSVLPHDKSHGNNHGEGIAQNRPESRSSLFDESRPILLPSLVKASAVTSNGGDDEASGSSASYQEAEIVGAEQDAKVYHTDSNRIPSLLGSTTESERHQLEGPTVDKTEIIVYEDNEEPAQGSSSGSSTIQGDVFDVTADESITKLEKSNRSGEIAVLHVTENAGNSNAGEENFATRTPHSRTNESMTEVEEQQHLKLLKSDPEYVDFSDEDEDKDSSHGRSGREVTSTDIAPPSQAPCDDASQMDKIKGFQDETVRQAQHIAATPQAVVFQEPQNLANNDHDRIEITHPADEEEHEYQSNVDGSDDETSNVMLSRIEDQEYAQHSHTNMKLNETKGTSVVGNADVVGESASVGRMELPTMLDSIGHAQDDDDEITFEDEDNEKPTSTKLPIAESNGVPSPVYSKRARSLHEDEDAIEGDLQDAKRFRST